MVLHKRANGQNQKRRMLCRVCEVATPGEGQSLPSALDFVLIFLNDSEQRSKFTKSICVN